MTQPEHRVSVAGAGAVAQAAVRAETPKPAVAHRSSAPMQGTVVAYIGIGANLGEPKQAVQQAMDALDDLDGVTVMARSSLYGSAPLDAGGGDYVNAVAEVRTALSAEDLLAQLHGIERGAGRERPFRNAPRTLDLDLLLYGDQVVDIEHLTVPHPRMWSRAFVLQPLSEIAPCLVSQPQLNAVSDQRVWRLPA